MAMRRLNKGRARQRISRLGLANFIDLSLRNEFYTVPQGVSLEQEILVAGQLLLLSPNTAGNGRAAEVALVLQSMVCDKPPSRVLMNTDISHLQELCSQMLALIISFLF